MSLGHDTLADLARVEFTPRGSDICPECGNAHTFAAPSVVLPLLISYFCQQCHSHWYVKGQIKVTNR